CGRTKVYQSKDSRRRYSPNSLETGQGYINLSLNTAPWGQNPKNGRPGGSSAAEASRITSGAKRLSYPVAASCRAMNRKRIGVSNQSIASATLVTYAR